MAYQREEFVPGCPPFSSEEALAECFSCSVQDVRDTFHEALLQAYEERDLPEKKRPVKWDTGEWDLPDGDRLTRWPSYEQWGLREFALKVEQPEEPELEAFKSAYARKIIKKVVKHAVYCIV